MKLPRLNLFTSFVGLFLPLSLIAQGQNENMPNTNSRETEDPVTLSPFVVSGEKVQGYLASTTLAGTRLREKLEDVGTSITVITTEFLRDTGATDSKSLLSYVTGAEVGGSAGNFLGGAVPKGYQGSPSENLSAGQAATRLRGLAAATEARDYYATSIPFDSYNIDRVEINRGANSTLFGTGSPAGIINSGLKRAFMRNSNVAELHYGSFGSRRGTIDVNQQIVPGELALRLNALDERQKYEQEFTFEDDRRFHADLVYSPKWTQTKSGMFSGTVLRANIESGKIDSRLPRVLPPMDNISGWFTPWFGAYPAKLTWDAGTLRTNSVVNGSTPYLSPGLFTTNSINRGASVWFNDPASSAPDTGTSIAGSTIVGMQGIISNLNSPLYATGTGVYLNAAPMTWAATRIPALTEFGFYTTPTLRNDTIFDFRRRLLEGPNRFSQADFTAYNFALEQRLLNDSAGVEVAFSKENFVSQESAYNVNNISLDLNLTLLNGLPNPNFGRPFTTGSWRNAYARDDQQTFRTTAYYRLNSADFVAEKWAKWLGRISFTALDEQGEVRRKSLSGPRFVSGTDYIYGNNQLITDSGGGALGQMSYIGSSLAGQSTPSGANILGLTALQSPSPAANQTFLFRRQVANSPFVTVPLAILEDTPIPSQFATNASLIGTDSHAQALVVQAKGLHDALVATFGWRRDKVEAFTAPVPGRGARNSLIVDQSWELGVTPSSTTEATTNSQSYVFHLPAAWIAWLPQVSSTSLRYNTSGNFSPGATRFDSSGTVLNSPVGKTKDVGFSVGFANNRVVLTTTWYETSQQNVTAQGVAGLTQAVIGTWGIFTNVTNLGLNPNASQILAPPQELLDLYGFKVTNGVSASLVRNDVVLSQDFVSKGVEVELFMNLTRNWRLIANVAQQKSTQDNTGSAFRELFFERQINGQTLYQNWTGPQGHIAKVNEGSSTLASWTNTNIVYPYYGSALQDGGVVQELREWRANLVTNYAFDRASRLRGFDLGTGIRWQSKQAIGFPVINDPSAGLIPDVKHPYFGPDELNVDAWIGYERMISRDRYKISFKLSIFNLLNDDDLIPVSTQPDGSVAVSRIPASRTFRLSTRFEF